MDPQIDAYAWAVLVNVKSELHRKRTKQSKTNNQCIFWIDLHVFSNAKDENEFDGKAFSDETLNCTH